MQAFASTPIRMCWFSQTDLAACCILHWLCGHAANPVHAAAQQPADSRIQKSLQCTAELSDVPMQASVHMPACSCVLFPAELAQLVPV
jgi:hypothetical protein